MKDSERNLRDLENEGSWAWEKAETRPAVESRRTVVSVAFPRAEYEQVARYASSVGMKTSEFIRNAALRMASGHGEALTTLSGSNGTFFAPAGSITGFDTRFPRVTVGVPEPLAATG